MAIAFARSNHDEDTAWAKDVGFSMFRVFALAATLATAACGLLTDAATRLAYDLEGAAGRLGQDEGAHYTLVHATPSRRGECDGRYKVQLDKVGLIVFWCYDRTGAVVSSPSTSYHANFVDTEQTFILDKAAGSPLRIDLERRHGRAVIVSAN